MPCYHPLPAWYAKRVNVTGKRGITFTMRDGYVDKPIQVPCGTCIGCRLAYARQWAVRCMHETKLHESNCFVTLTYDDAHLPENKSLRPRDFVLFMKRLRKKYGEGIRFFQCGEYGSKDERPHHHALLFNHEFSDRVFHKNTGGSGGLPLYVSAELERLWGFGYCWIGTASFRSAGYIARYALKKVFGPRSESHYNGRVPEYLTMSRRPGIGSEWFKRYASDYYPSDEVVMNSGIAVKPPRYYDALCERLYPELWRRGIKYKRRVAAESDPDNVGSRLVVREEVKNAAITFLKREL